MDDKVSQLDMMQGKVFEAELGELAAKLEAKRMQFQMFVDGVYAKHGKVKGEDRLQLDGTWAKVE